MAAKDWNLRICYLNAAGFDREVTVDAEGMARPADAVRELGIAVRTKKGAGYSTRRATVCPASEITLTAVTYELRGVGLEDARALYLNGYNSWTDSVEHDPHDGMRGLVGVPKPVVDRWVLDSSGDYRFVAQDARPGHQHGFGYGYLRHGALTTLLGGLDEDGGFTVIHEDLEADALRFEKEPPRGALAVGEEREVFSLAVCRGTFDEAFACWLKLAGITRRVAPALVGYSSWYRHYGNISADKLLQDLDEVITLLGGCELGACQPVFQIDDGYTRVGDWLEYDDARFPKGLAPLAAKTAEAGLMPGLWLAPFMAEEKSRLYHDHKDWLLHDEAGELVHAGSNWSGAYALDLDVPEAREYVRTCLSTVTREWGFRLLKLDFLYAACLLPSATQNRGQRMAEALDFLRSCVPEGTYFDLCGVPLVSAFGRTEYCRIGPDVGLDWDDVPYMRALHRERVSTKRSLANTKARAHLDGRVFRNDPDVFFLRRDVKLTDEQRADLLASDATLGGVFFTSDAVGEWDAGQLYDFKLALKRYVEREA